MKGLRAKLFVALLLKSKSPKNRKFNKDEFAELRAMCAMRASVVYVPTYQRVKSVPASQFYLPTCQSAYKRAKSVPIFQLVFKRIFQFLNFSIMLKICKFQEYLRSTRKFTSRNK